MLKTKVKVSHITNLSDARYCAGMGVDLLGFPVTGKDAIDPSKFKEITDWVAGPEFVLEWLSTDAPDQLLEIIPAYNASIVEIDARHLENISLPSRLIVRFHASEWALIEPIARQHKSRIEYLLVTGAAGETIDVPLLTKIGGEFPLLLGYGVHSNNVSDLEHWPVSGIALSGSNETQPGLKDYSGLSEILEALETER